MKKIIILVTLLFSIQYVTYAQDATWKTLGKLSWKRFYDKDLGFDVSQPVFSDDVQELNGKEIEITGYIIPVDLEGDYQVLSAFPYSNCFFCGGAGPETVMELDMKKNNRLTNEKVVLKGILRLNNDDFQKLIYRLDDVELVTKY